jgi:uncharacterized protein
MSTIDPLTLGLVIRSAIFTCLALAIVCLLIEKLPRVRTFITFFLIALTIHLGWLVLAGPPGASSVGYPIQSLRVLSDTWTLSSVVIVVVGLPVVFGIWITRFFKRIGPIPSTSWREQPVNSARRRFLAGALPFTAVTVSGAGTLNGMRPFEVRHVEMKLRGLPPALNGFRIGQTTDLHVGNFIDPEYVAHAVETLNEAGVDLQVMTGDLIDDMVRIPQTFAALEKCQAKYGMLAILGNHEKYFGLPEVLRAYDSIASRGKVRLLVDSSVVIEHQGHPLRIVGVDYPVYPGMDHPLPASQTMALMKQSAEKAFTDVGEDETVFCLAHHPNFFPLAAERGALLTLSGHTHGGQVAMMGVSLFSFAFKYILGSYQLGDSHLYVSGGTGHWIPIRFGVPTEVTILTLRSA